MAKKDTVQVAGVDKTYEERPDASRSDEENVLAEGRHLREDQIADYHQKNKTLDPKSAPEQVEIDAMLFEETTKAAKKATTKDAVAEAVEESQV